MMQVIQEYILVYLNNHQVEDESNDLVDVSFVLLVPLVVVVLLLSAVVVLVHFLVDLLAEQHQLVEFEPVLML